MKEIPQGIKRYQANKNKKTQALLEAAHHNHWAVRIAANQVPLEALHHHH